MIKNGRVLIRSVKRGGLNYVAGIPELHVTVDSVKYSDEDYAKLWHSRLGHIGQNGLIYLFRTWIIDKHPCDSEFCEDCVYDKKAKHSFGKSTYTVSRVLEFLHAGLWGPAQVPTVGGRRYFLSIIDHY